MKSTATWNTYIRNTLEYMEYIRGIHGTIAQMQIVPQLLFHYICGTIMEVWEDPYPCHVLLKVTKTPAWDPGKVSGCNEAKSCWFY